MSIGTRRITVSVISGSLGLSFNTVLAYIIITTNCYIGNYKYLLLLYTVNAAIYSSCQMTTTATIMLFPDGYALYDVFRLLPYTVGWVVLNFYTVTFIQNPVILVNSFIYRYLAICSPRGMDLYHRHWMKVVLISLMVAGYVDFAVVYGLLPSAKSDELFAGKFYHVTGHNISDTPYTGALMQHHGEYQWPFFFALISLSILLVTSAGIIVITAVKITKKLKTFAYESQTMANQQKKIFTLLIFQVCLPLVFNILPIQFAVISTYFQLPADFIVENEGCIITVAQIIDPLLTFYYIKPYWQALWGRMFQSRVTSGLYSDSGEEQRGIQLNPH